LRCEACEAAPAFDDIASKKTCRLTSLAALQLHHLIPPPPLGRWPPIISLVGLLRSWPLLRTRLGLMLHRTIVCPGSWPSLLYSPSEPYWKSVTSSCFYRVDQLPGKGELREISVSVKGFRIKARHGAHQGRIFFMTTKNYHLFFGEGCECFTPMFSTT